MRLKSILAAGVAVAPSAYAIMLRFFCSQLVVDRLDPLVNPGALPSPHLHQIVGGNAFNASMDASAHDVATTATCTSCTVPQDKSNYWTAVMFFRARNGTFYRLPTMGNPLGFTDANGGMTVYYLTNGKATSFKPGFRMTVGDPNFRTAEQIKKYPSLIYTCLQTAYTRGADTTGFPTGTCAAGIMVSLRFPTCWDGKNLDSADHQSHTAYPVNNQCPSTHPVTIPQVFYEAIWDTRQFNDKSLWPADGSQPFVWSFGDKTGYGSHGDYVFGWEGNALQSALDSSNCNSDLLGNSLNCSPLNSQSVQKSNQCTVKRSVDENLDGWLTQLPGGMPVA
ncbi:hypothetical protein UCDDA912_g03527 [Diaporthe ampelina]|uniref:DUF1996 domain-containing protein n=1 Tax=Diaporthe ampelina TaxID=1214573 RepID=A0A0G2FR22_9PEZI|nr:hypothetical protein UCDDA912_g03527 [Diaporthe ampelina]